MPTCSKCGRAATAEARFCANCGSAIAAGARLPERRLPTSRTSAPPEWATLDEVIYTRDKRPGAIGALLALFGSFAPWTSASMSLWGMELGSYHVGSPQAWLVALVAAAAAVFLFRKQSGSVVLALGVALGAWAILFALTTLSNQSSPSWGVLLTIVGGALLAYSGNMTNQYERG